jgi:hypothetical protein
MPPSRDNWVRAGRVPSVQAAPQTFQPLIQS